MKKKYFYSNLENHDREKDDSTIRQLEMSVDSVAPSIEHSLQFWKDVRLYGVDEAILYLEYNMYEKQSIKLKDTWNAIKNRLG